MRRVRFGLLLGLLVAACVWIPVERESVRVGSDLANPPFAWVDDAGIERGRDVEMMQWLADRAWLRLEWVRMPFEELLDAVAEGRVDVVCATLGVTPERAERVDFTRPYFVTELRVVVPTGSARSLDDLTGRRVGAGAGTTSERAVRAKLPNVVGVFENKTGHPTAQRLLEGELAAAVMDGPAAAAMTADSQGRLEILPYVLDEERYSLAVDPDRPGLRDALDAALRDADREGHAATWNKSHGL